MRRTLFLTIPSALLLFACAEDAGVSGPGRGSGHASLPNPYLGEGEAGQREAPSIVGLITSAEACPAGIERTVDAVKGPYLDIQAAVNTSAPGDSITVKPGTYPGFRIDGKSCLSITGQVDAHNRTIVSGSLPGQTDSCRGPFDVTILVRSSTFITLSTLSIAGGAHDDAVVWYASSTGTIRKSEISGTRDNPGSPSPAAGILVLGCHVPSDVTVDATDVHDFGKVGIVVHSFIMPGTRATISNGTVRGRVLDDANRVQDGIQVLWSAQATIEFEQISDCNNQIDPTWSSNGILVAEANATVAHTTILNCYDGLTTTRLGGKTLPVLLSDGNTVRGNTDCGVVLDGTDSQTLISDTLITGNGYGLWQVNHGFGGPVVTNFNNGDLRGNSAFDVVQDPESGDVTLSLDKTKYKTYHLYPGGTGRAMFNVK